MKINLVTIFSIILFVLSELSIGQEIPNYFAYNVSRIVEDTAKSSSSVWNDLIETDLGDIQYELKVNEHHTLFLPIEKINNSQSAVINFNQLFQNTQGKFYYDHISKLVENQKSFGGKNFIVEHSFDHYEWKTSESIETVLGYECKKAVYTRIDLGLKTDKIYQITVWYDENFDQNIAPFGLVGLPGLIVKVNFNNHFIAELAEMSFEPNGFKISPFRKGQRISNNDFQALIDEEILKYRRRNNQVLDKD